MYQIERAGNPEELLAQTDRWNALASGVPLRQSAWLGAWWQCFGKQAGEPYLVTARRGDGRLCGLLPLYRVSRGQGRTLSAIGDGAACTDHWSVLTGEAEDGAEIAAAIGGWLASAAASSDDGWDAMDIDGVVAGDPAIAALVQALCARGALTHACSRMSLWFKPITESWDQYLMSLGKTHRRQVRRFAQRIATTDDLQLHLPESAAEVAHSLDALIDLHQRRWNQAGQPGSYASAAMRAFIHDAAARFFQLDQLRLPTLRWQGRVIAGELNLIGQDRVLYCYSSGLDPDFNELQPGRILNVETLQYAYRQGLAGIDLMRGDEPYKGRMHAVPQPVARLRVVAAGWMPRLRYAAWRTGFEFKQWVRRGRGRGPLATIDLVSPAPAGDTARDRTTGELIAGSAR